MSLASPSLDSLRDMLRSHNMSVESYQRVPIKRELYADFITPICALRALKARSQEVFLLESIEDSKRWGRYSFLGLHPSAEIKIAAWQVELRSSDERILALHALSSDPASVEWVDSGVSGKANGKGSGKVASGASGVAGAVGGDGGACVRFVAEPKRVLREILRLYKSPKCEGMPPFTGGLVGYFAYDSIAYAESVLDFARKHPRPESRAESSAPESTQIPTQKSRAWQPDDSSDDMHLMLFEHVVVFDHFTQKLLLITNLDLADLADLDASYARGVEKLDFIAHILQSSTNPPESSTTDSPAPESSSTNSTPSPRSCAKPHPFAPFSLTSPFQRYFDESGFCQIVRRAKHYITQGDIFQVVLSNPIQARARGSLLNVYRVLRTSNPSPYMFYLSSADLEITGSSPETLVRLEDSTLYTYPLAGSRPRGADEAADKALEQELLHDEKELSEHNMLVDLARNDMGRVARIGSVEVAAYKQVVRYSHIMHIASTIKAELDAGQDALSALEAILPAGTLSGAPKIRACEIIHELENIPESGRRGIYGGAIGYMDFSGNMDTCIAIRLVYKKGERVFVRSGAGIVHDSDERAEWRELENKAKAILHALEVASAGLD